MEISPGPKPKPAPIKLKPIDATPATFKEFGQVVDASPDGDAFGPQDAQLDLSRGIPRLGKFRLFLSPRVLSSIIIESSDG